MFGASEPRLPPLDPTLAARAALVRTAVTAARLRGMVEALPAPRVRLYEPEAMAGVDTLIYDAFTNAGWRAERQRFMVRDALAWAEGSVTSPLTSPVAFTPGFRGVNVIGTKKGATSDAIVVVAHHDTVPGTGGADDNGSGVIALMELARLLGPVRLHRSVVLAAVDHEELGFWGSQHLVTELSVRHRVVGAYVFEMLAYWDRTPGSQRLPPGIGLVYRDQVRRVRARGLRGDFLGVLYQQSSQWLAVAFAECLAHIAGPAAPLLLRAPTDLPVAGSVLERAVPFARDFARSDHVPFWEAGLPAVQLTDTANFRNPHYHGAGDTPETLDYDSLADVVAAAALAVERVAGRVEE